MTEGKTFLFLQYAEVGRGITTVPLWI